MSNVLMVIMPKMEVVFLSQFFVVENITNRQVNAQDVLMDISSKVENVFTQLSESIQLVKNTVQADFVTNVLWVTTFLTTDALKSIISVQSSITQDRFVLNVIIKLLKVPDVFEIRRDRKSVV